jgi:hypothetical protein
MKWPTAAFLSICVLCVAFIAVCAPAETVNIICGTIAVLGVAAVAMWGLT